jgi:phage terminase large subunit-like protein
MAASVLQASQAFNFIHGAIEGSSHLSRLIESVTADTISLASGVNIQVRPASFRTIRGISAVGAICDEIAFFRSDDAKNPDEEIIRALRPSLATTGGPLICISSPYAKAGMLWKTFRKHYGLHGASEVAKAASRQMNPSLSARVGRACLRGGCSRSDGRIRRRLQI